MSETVDQEARIRVGVVENAVEKIEQAVVQIADSMQQLARLEERHAATRTSLDRAFCCIEDNKAAVDRLAGRVSSIERHMPGLIELRKWVITAVVAIVGLVGTSVVGMALVRDGQPPPRVAR